MKYLKVIKGTTSDANTNIKYKINEVNIATKWNKNAKTPEDMGGFNFSTENKILRWLLRGDVLYEVIIPDDAEVIECESISAPHGVFRTNKIIITNPKKVTDDVAMELYKKSDLPWKSYIQILSYLAAANYKNTAYQIVKDKITSENATDALEIYDNFLKIKPNPMPELYIEIKEKINNMSKREEE